jgi:hypothetical protein
MKNNNRAWRRFLLIPLVLVSILLVCAACDSNKGPVVSGISIQPNDKPQTVFVKGQDLDLSAGKLTVTNDDGTQKVIELNDPAITVTGHDKNTVGDQNLVITYEGKSINLSISVVERMTFTGYEKEYFVNDKFNTSRGSVVVVKDDGSKITVRLNDPTISVDSFDSSAAGTRPVTIRYASGTEEYTDTLDVMVYNVGSIKFVKPTRITYGSHETELSLLGGYFQVTAEGNEALTKFVDLTQEMASGFNPGVATTENIKTPVKQAIVFNYAGQMYQFEISITYSGVSLMRDAIKELADVQLDVEKPSITEAQGKIALDALQEYMKLTPAERAKVEKEGTNRIARIAAMYGNAYANILAQPFSKAISIVDGAIALEGKAAREDVIAAIEMLSDNNNEFVVFSKFLEEFAAEFAKVEIVPGQPIEKVIKYVSEDNITYVISVLEFMLQLHDDMVAIPDDWTVETLAANVDHIDNAVRHIRNYNNPQLIGSICGIVSQWRAKNDYVRIIYTYYYAYESSMIRENLLGQVPMPGDMNALYSYFANAANTAMQLQNAGINALWADIWSFYLYAGLCEEYSEKILNGDDELCKNLYKVLEMDAAIDAYVRYSQTGYINLVASLYEDPEFVQLMDVYFSLIKKYADRNRGVDFDTDKEELQQVFDLFVAMTPAKQRAFMNAMYYLYGREMVRDNMMFAYPDDQIKGLYVFLVVSYFEHYLPEAAHPIIQNLLLAMEYYLNNSTYDDAMSNFLSKMQVVIADYNALTPDEKVVFDQYMGTAYDKYFKLYQINRRPAPSDLTKFEALRDELLQAVRDYENIRDNMTDVQEDGSAKIKEGMTGALVASYENVMRLIENLRNHEDEQIRALVSTMDITVGEDYVLPIDYFAQNFRWTFVVLTHNITYTFKNEDGTDRYENVWNLFHYGDMTPFWREAYYVINQQYKGAEEFDTAKVMSAMQAYREQLTNRPDALGQFYTFDGDFYYYAGLETFFGKVLTEGNVALGNKLLEVEKLYVQFAFSNFANEEAKTAFMNAMAEVMQLVAAVTDTENFDTYLADLYNFYLNLYNGMNTEA